MIWKKKFKKIKSLLQILLSLYSNWESIRSVDLDNWFPWIAVMFRFLDYITTRYLRLHLSFPLIAIRETDFYINILLQKTDRLVSVRLSSIGETLIFLYFFLTVYVELKCSTLLSIFCDVLVCVCE